MSTYKKVTKRFTGQRAFFLCCIYLKCDRTYVCLSYCSFVKAFTVVICAVLKMKVSYESQCEQVLN